MDVTLSRSVRLAGRREAKTPRGAGVREQSFVLALPFAVSV